MLLDFLILDPEFYTLMTFNISIWIGIMFLFLSVQRVSFGFRSPFANVTDVQHSELKNFDINTSLLIQYFITRRITRSIRNKGSIGDDTDASFPLIN